MNLFRLFFNDDLSAFDLALIQPAGQNGYHATIERLKEAEERVRAMRREGGMDRASSEAYVDAIACARQALERFFGAATSPAAPRR